MDQNTQMLAIADVIMNKAPFRLRPYYEGTQAWPRIRLVAMGQPHDKRGKSGPGRMEVVLFLTGDRNIRAKHIGLGVNGPRVCAGVQVLANTCSVWPRLVCKYPATVFLYPGYTCNALWDQLWQIYCNDVFYQPYEERIRV